MRSATQRVFLSGLTLGPAVASIAVPFSSAGSLLASAAGAGAGIVALVSSFAPVKAKHGTSAADVLMSPAMRQRLGWELPDWPSMQSAIAEAIRIQPTERDPISPPDRAAAIAQTLRRLLAQLGCSTPAHLGTDATLVVYVILMLLQAPPEEAGRLGQYFRDPHILIDLREEVDRIDLKFQCFDAGHKAYLATLRLWDSQPPRPAKRPLSDSIRSLETPDIDLWHRVALDHDPMDHEQRNAALWCLCQKQCDRASIASYMSLIARNGHLIQAVRNGDNAYLEQVLAILKAWNNGDYRVHELGLAPEVAVQGQATRFSETLDEVQRITGQPRWPDPHGMFVDYTGRMPRSRENWNLKRGQLVEAPLLADYIDLPGDQAV
ncbi:MAG: hypothetical protein N4A61_01485 [Pelagimonas sp.]|nr:hypothetical protein [Pelagimonas sp.]